MTIYCLVQIKVHFPIAEIFLSFPKLNGPSFWDTQQVEGFCGHNNDSGECDYCSAKSNFEGIPTKLASTYDSL